MLKTKDGYAKVIGTSYYGSSDYLLLSNGDSKAISSLSVNYATSAGNADTLDGVHLNGIFTAFLANGNATRLVIGGVTKDLTIPYASLSPFLCKNSTFNSTGLAGLQYYDGDMSNTTNNNSWSVPSSGWHLILHLPLSVNGYFTELSFPVNDVNGLAWRLRRNSSYYGWYRILDSNNYSSYVKKIGTSTVGSSSIPIYLNAGTPTLCSTTLGVSITGNAATATTLQTTRTLWGLSFNGSANVSGNMSGVGLITFSALSGTNGRALLYLQMADNDYFRIYAGGTASNSGYVEIATSDDGNEPIYVRQYTGVFSSVKRTLTLLDANGYTHFPSYINIGGNENNNSSPDRVWGSNGSDSYLRSYRTSALRVANADTVDGYHANGLFTAFGNDLNNISATVGGVTKKFEVKYSNHSYYSRFIKGDDLRNANNAPNYYMNTFGDASLCTEFSLQGKLFGNGTYVNLITSTPWRDSGGGRPALLAIGNYIGLRSATNDSTWGAWRTIPTIDANGVMEIGKFIDWHWNNEIYGSQDFSTRLQALNTSSYPNTVYLPTQSGELALLNLVELNLYHVVDMRNYDSGYWHPVTVGLPKRGYNKIKVSVELDIGDKPSWATHSDGFTCNMEIWAEAHGWGTTNAETICLNYTYSQCNSNPCGWKLLGYPSLGVLFLRGGSRYKVWTDFDATFTPHDKTYTWTSESGGYTQSTGGPYTSCPGLDFVKNIIYANLNGTADNADKLDGYHASYSSSTPWGTIPVITTTGFMDIGKHLEFHHDNTTGSDYSTILTCTGNYSNIVNLPSKSGTLALTKDVLTFSNENANYLSASFNNPDFSKKAASKYIECWDNEGGWWNFMAGKFMKAGSSDAYVLLGGGGHKPLSEFLLGNGSYLPYNGWWSNGSGLDVNDANGMIFAYATHKNTPFSSSWGIITTFDYTYNSAYKFLLAANGYSNAMYYRSRSSDRGGWTSWALVIDTGNIGSLTVDKSYHLRVNHSVSTNSTWSTWYWLGQSGQPTWLWGTNDGINCYVWNPSNFSVKYATSAGYVSNSLNIFGVSYNGSSAKTVTTSTFVSLLSEGTSTVTDGTMFITSVVSNSGFADTSAVNVPYKRKASCLWSYIDSKVSSKYLPLAGGTMNGNARIGHGSGNLYIGNSGNDGWIYTQDIASLKGTDKWAIRESGAAHFGAINIASKTDNSFNSNVIECNSTINLNYFSSLNVSLCNGGGNVGIGTTSPSYKLHVAGNGYFSDTVYSNILNHTSSTGHLIIGNKTKEISIRSSDLPDVPAVYLLQKFSTNVYYTANKGFGIRPYYLSNIDSRPMETISGNIYSVVTVGDSVLAISCIIADKANIASQIKGTLIRFLPGDDGQIVLLKDLNNYGAINGYFYVLPKNCNIVRSDNSNIFIADGNISSAYDDGKSRFFIYAKTYNIWIEFYCG